jgi:hypothetical protein
VRTARKRFPDPEPRGGPRARKSAPDVNNEPRARRAPDSRHVVFLELSIEENFWEKKSANFSDTQVQRWSVEYATDEFVQNFHDQAVLMPRQTRKYKHMINRNSGNLRGSNPKSRTEKDEVSTF